MTDSRTIALSDICAVALAECFRGDGEIVANPIGPLPVIGGRLARATFAPDLMMTDGGALLIADDAAFEWPEGPTIESYNPYRSMFEVCWGGRRHVVMGAVQLDAHGNQNLAAVGSDYARPTTQFVGFRGAPGNTINHTTSYWIPNHSTRVFVEAVDFVTGVGWDALDDDAGHLVDLRRVVTNLAVLDWDTPDRRMRVRSVHPGVTVDQVVAATGFELAIPDDVPTTRLPTDEELRLLDAIDPGGVRASQVRD